MRSECILVNSRKTNRVIKQCKVCGKDFAVQPSKVNRIHSCDACRPLVRKPPVTLTCECCGRAFVVRGYLGGVQRFCSPTCRWNAYVRQPTKWQRVCAAAERRRAHSRSPRVRATYVKTCLECGESFETTTKRAIYCSRACVASSQKRDDWVCDYCGEAFHPGVRKNNTKTGLRFCCTAHRAAYTSGERHPLYVGEQDYRRDYRGIGWDDVAEAVRQRDNHTCQRCGAKQNGRALDVHHVIPYRVSKDNYPDNLVTLCARCHKTVEAALPR